MIGCSFNLLSGGRQHMGEVLEVDKVSKENSEYVV